MARYTLLPAASPGATPWERAHRTKRTICSAPCKMGLCQVPGEKETLERAGSVQRRKGRHLANRAVADASGSFRSQSGLLEKGLPTLIRRRENSLLEDEKILPKTTCVPAHTWG